DHRQRGGQPDHAVVQDGRVDRNRDAGAHERAQRAVQQPQRPQHQVGTPPVDQDPRLQLGPGVAVRLVQALDLDPHPVDHAGEPVVRGDQQRADRRQEESGRDHRRDDGVGGGDGGGVHWATLLPPLPLAGEGWGEGRLLGVALIRPFGAPSPASGRREASGYDAPFAFASRSQVSTTVSGFSDTDSMPCSISHCARSGWSLGPWPQMPTYLPFSRAVRMAIDSSFLTAGSRSSNSWATMPESRSRPRVSWVRSLEPIEKPSKISRNSSASRALEGTSHIMMIFRPSLPCSRPLARSTSTTLRPSSSVRTNGIITQTLSRPISPRTRRTAWHSSAKASAKLGST